MTTLLKIGGRFINLAAVFRINPEYVASKWDQRAPSDTGVEILLSDGNAGVVLHDAEAEAFRRFLAGELVPLARISLGGDCEVYDFTATFPAPEPVEGPA